MQCNVSFHAVMLNDYDKEHVLYDVVFTPSLLFGLGTICSHPFFPNAGMHAVFIGPGWILSRRSRHLSIALFWKTMFLVGSMTRAKMSYRKRCAQLVHLRVLVSTRFYVTAMFSVQSKRVCKAVAEGTLVKEQKRTRSCEITGISLTITFDCGCHYTQCKKSA
jgi:hypothetical protein